MTAVAVAAPPAATGGALLPPVRVDHLGMSKGGNVDYWVGRDGQQYGPYRDSDLKKWLLTGQLDLDDLVWHEDLDLWITLRTLFQVESVPARTSVSPSTRATGGTTDSEEAGHTHPPLAAQHDSRPVSPEFGARSGDATTDAMEPKRTWNSASPPTPNYGTPPPQPQPQPPKTKPAADYEIVLLAVPVVATILVWMWVGNMNLLQGPESSITLIVVSTVVGTAIVAAMEAGKVGMTSDRIKGTYTPTAWFFIITLLWILGYPIYLYKRSYYGLTNRLLAGALIALVFTCSVFIMDSAIESKKAEIRANMEHMQQEAQRQLQQQQQQLQQQLQQLQQQ